MNSSGVSAYESSASCAPAARWASPPSSNASEEAEQYQGTRDLRNPRRWHRPCHHRHEGIARQCDERRLLIHARRRHVTARCVPTHDRRLLPDVVLCLERPITVGGKNVTAG